MRSHAWLVLSRLTCLPHRKQYTALQTGGPSRENWPRHNGKSRWDLRLRSPVEEQLPVDFCCICLYEPADNCVIVTSVGSRSEALAMELAMTRQARIEIDQNGLSRCVRGRLVYEPDISCVPFPFAQRLASGA